MTDFQERLRLAQEGAKREALLSIGYSREEVEGVLSGTLPPPGGYTALTDPTNVLMREVAPVGQPTHERGPVDIMGVTTRTNTSEHRTCRSEGCLQRIAPGQRYERVARLNQKIESYHTACFEDEFGPRELYGD